MADATQFEDTQIAADGRRYKASDIEKVNAELGKDGKTSVSTPDYGDAVEDAPPASTKEPAEVTPAAETSVDKASTDGRKSRN